MAASNSIGQTFNSFKSVNKVKKHSRLETVIKDIPRGRKPLTKILPIEALISPDTPRDFESDISDLDLEDQGIYKKTQSENEMIHPKLLNINSNHCTE